MSVRNRVFVGLCAVVACCVGPVGSAAAETPSPWFHLASLARPGNLSAGVGGDEVQRVSVSATAGEFVLIETRAFTPLFFKWDASHEEVQTALEGVYGAGNVTVTGGPGDEEGSSAYVITFTGALAEMPVAPLDASFSAFFLSCTGAVGANCKATATSEVTGARPDGYVVATAVNVGEAGVTGPSDPVRLVDRLPAGLRAVSAVANTRNSNSVQHQPVECSVVSAQLVECSYSDKLPPYQQIEVAVGVVVGPTAATGEEGEVAVSGGGAPSTHARAPIVVSGAPTPFGVESYALTPEEVGGAVDSQAGSHPFQLTTTFDLKQVLDPFVNDPLASWAATEAVPAGLGKDLAFRLPAGLIGNPNAVARCTLAQFNGRTEQDNVPSNLCPAGSVVGVATVGVNIEHKMESGMLPLYNLTPGVGEPARFAFQPAGVPVILDTSVRTGEDYGVTVSVHNISQSIGFLSNTVTFWGVPGDPRHDGLRGSGCMNLTAEDPIAHGVCQPLEESSPQPLLSLPTSCSGGPLVTSVTAASWAQPLAPISPDAGHTSTMPTMDGCGRLPFASEINVTPDLLAGSTPTGLKVDVHVPQEEALNANGLSPADVRNITVALPEGLQLNPSAADGLQSCSLSQIGFKGENPTSHVQEFTPDEPSCPDASKVASVTLKLPILPVGQNVTGFLYLAAPQNFQGLPENPFSSLVAMYLVAKDKVSGISVKLPGSVALSATGQITASFQNNPQAPFEDAEIQFFGGSRAPLATPARCTSYTTNAVFEPWSNGGEINEQRHSASHFNITTGPGASPCPGATLPFAPTLSSQTSNINAGSFTPLVTTISRVDGQQALQSVTLHYPPGVSGVLAGIPLCPEAQANAGTCPEGSQIGETIVSVGVGGDPFTVTGGKVYLTEKYAGAPFGLSIVNPAKAGPFNLQEGHPVVVRARVNIDPSTAALTITTGQIPAVIDGFPLQIKHVNVTITRPGFTFNPTNCNPTAITATITGAEGATAPVSVPFQVTNCAALKFEPKFSVSTSGNTSKANGASLTAKVTYPNVPQGTDANLAKVKVELPKQLPSRLTTLQKACLAKVFEANPAACPSQSVVGHARVITPVLPVPLEGPAYFVSHGGAAFPDLTIVLQGYGVTVELVGTTFIDKHGVTSSTFKTTPDVPFKTFELTLPQGPFSAVTANTNLCQATLAMPTEFTAQNGAEIHQSTPIEVTGCSTKLALISHTLHGRTLTLKVYVPGAGKLHASGNGLSSASKSANGRGTVTITLHVKKNHRFKTKLKLTFAPSTGHGQAKSITIRA
jgi:hypothetical protein